MEAMERLIQGRTTFMIAHHLSTLRNSDVRELSAGRIREIARGWQGAKMRT
jgi:ABC-type multidrug transport system fused ATPase/permease subunit